MHPAAMTRRAALALPLLAVAACARQADAPAPSGQTDLASVTDESRLIAQYDAAIAAFPALRARLAAIREQHVAHLASLGGASASAPAEPAASAAAPRTPQEAVTSLAAAEKAASVLRLDDCVAAADPALARTLALIAASESSHVAELLGA